MINTERLSFRILGTVAAALLILLMLVNAIPWATKSEVKELKNKLDMWYGSLQPRVIRVEEKLDHVKETVDKIYDRTNNKEE